MSGNFAVVKEMSANCPSVRGMLGKNLARENLFLKNNISYIFTSVIMVA